MRLKKFSVNENMPTNTSPLIFLMGPTASGKTSIAINLVEELSADIISVDSAMVYRGMDIGTAKPSAQQLVNTPHRLIDICDPIDPYSAGNFVRDATIEIEEIQNQDKISLLVGGTGLYFRSLEQGFSQLPPADSKIRSRLVEEANEHGWAHMYSKLTTVDPVSAERIHKNDPQRIQRALEIFEITGKAASDLYSKGRFAALKQPILKIIVAPEERKTLHKIIKVRFLQMIEDGLVDEVKHLFERGDLNATMPSMRLVGYRQVWSYLEGRINYNDMINKAIIATRQLAKRQLTWLRSEQNALWIDSNKPNLSQYLLNYFRSNPLTSDRL